MSSRGKGLTTRQMLNAPRNAVFIWANSNLGHPLDLAERLGRQDLSIFSPSFLEWHAWERMGKNFVVIDHACTLNDRQRAGLQKIIDHGFLI